MNSDPEDTALLIGAVVSITLFGCCLFGHIFRGCCMRPRMKESRSDGDLTQLTQVSSGEQYA